jgi:hypothetical protein
LWSYRFESIRAVIPFDRQDHRPYSLRRSVRARRRCSARATAEARQSDSLGDAGNADARLAALKGNFLLPFPSLRFPFPSLLLPFCGVLRGFGGENVPSIFELSISILWELFSVIAAKEATGVKFSISTVGELRNRR